LRPFGIFGTSRQEKSGNPERWGGGQKPNADTWSKGQMASRRP
jgi:hypothetical protein